ncbi:hypothetical protein OAV71_00910 [Opitutales bacterium]|nr:hypothetical protein [Opitutales bacterium]
MFADILFFATLKILAALKKEEAIYPDYIKMCEGFGVKARRIIKREDLHDGIQEMLDADEPFLLEVIVPHTEHVLPMIPQGKSAKEMLID